jgi:hypothetical protein
MQVLEKGDNPFLGSWNLAMGLRVDGVLGVFQKGQDTEFAEVSPPINIPSLLMPNVFRCNTLRYKPTILISSHPY